MTLEHLAGRLTLTLTHDGAAVTHCHSEFSRPPLAARLLTGAAPADAAARLAPLFAVCRRAHALAADLAAQALHGPAAPRPEALAELEAEARQDILRRTLGRVIENLYSTPERDRFRTRVERGANGTEIYIAHRGMVEVYTDNKKDSTIWQPPISRQLPMATKPRQPKPAMPCGIHSFRSSNQSAIGAKCGMILPHALWRRRRGRMC